MFTVHILVGLPGSGKTTYISDFNNIVAVSGDSMIVIAPEKSEPK